MNKINQSNIVLLLVGIAFIIKQVISNTSYILYIIGFGLILLSLIRTFLYKKLLEIKNEPEVYSDDIIKKYFKKDVTKYIDMLDLYEHENIELTYDQNDGIVLHDNINDIYYATALSEMAAKDCLYKIKGYKQLITHDQIFDSMNISYTTKKEITLYVYTLDLLKVNCDIDITIKQEDNKFIAYLNDLNIGSITIDNLQLKDLYVKEEYRNKNVGNALLSASINHLLKQDKVPYYICEDNLFETNISFTKTKLIKYIM